MGAGEIAGERAVEPAGNVAPVGLLEEAHGIGDSARQRSARLDDAVDDRDVRGLRGSRSRGVRQARNEKYRRDPYPHKTP
jgi:hypothetical protein